MDYTQDTTKHIKGKHFSYGVHCKMKLHTLKTE